jgi:gentisate 1,2-dioxygenase
MKKMRMNFAERSPEFVDCTGVTPSANSLWAPVIITAEQIDAEIERLASLPLPANSRRSSLIVHPDASAIAPALAPGIQVSLNVLRPGETTAPFRHNATEVNFCIRGSGYAVTAGRRVEFRRFDTWNTPSYVPYWRGNTGTDIQACLTYSNVPLLQLMQVYLWDSNAQPVPDLPKKGHSAGNTRRKNPYGTFRIGDDGAMLMPYELLIDPPAVASTPLFWPWERVKAELKKLEDLGDEYVGRRLYLLYNPVTGRANGTTPNFFATITIRPPNIVDRPHRHVSAAINYYFQGRGRSAVAGNVYEWKAGDLMLSAPGWAVHNHASYDEVVYEITVQDQPLNILMESLLWQENMKQEPALLGVDSGFSTNRQAVTENP